MNIRKFKKFFNYNVFYSLLILLLVISFTFQNIAIAQNTHQQQSNDSTEHFSLVLSLDPEGEAIVNYTFQQGNLLAIVYGKSNLKVIDLDTENIVYEISYPESRIYQLYLVGNYLLYWLNDRVETVRVDLSIKEKESISFPGSSNQITDDGHLITHHGNRCQLIDLDEGQKLFEPDVSKSGRGKILCVDDVIIFPFVDSQGNSAGYKAVSTNGKVKFTLKESFNEVRIFLPEYHSKISTFPLPILINRNYRDKNKKQWFLEFINKEGQTINSYSPADLGIDYSWNRVNSPLWVLDENQDNFLLQISSWKKGESQTKFYYILTDLSGNVLQVFDETSNCTAAIDSQGNILLHQVGGPSHILNYYQQDGTLIFNKQIPCLLEAGAPTRFKFLSENEILEWEYSRFEKYSLTNGEMTGIYPISTDYQIYLKNTIIYDNKVYFFAKPRPGFKPKITGSNYFSFSAADSGWLDIELISIRPNAGTTYKVWDNTEVKVKFRTEYGASFGENLSVNFEKGEVLVANNRNLEYIWHTPTIVSGNQGTAKITVSYGPVSQEFIITIKDHLPMASFTFDPISPQTEKNVRFDASLSSDLDGEITAYHWDFGDGTVEQEQEQDCIDHIFSTAGEYPVTLTITDNNGQTARISQNITVKAAPIANFKLLAPSPEWNTRTPFDGSLSSDPDGSIVSYQWDFGDGTVGEGVNVSHEFNEKSTYDVTLTVTDDQNLSNSKTITIVIGWVLSYENNGDIGIPAALVDGNVLEYYPIEVITGNCDDAGTDSRVFIALYGPETHNGRYGSGEIQLQSFYDWLGSFEKGNKDTFNVSGYNLEEIEFITLRHANDQNKPGWYVKAIKIKKGYSIYAKEWLFVPDQWLAMDELPEYQTWGKFLLVEPYNYGILFRGEDHSVGMIEASDSIFILPENIEEYFYFTMLEKGLNLEVFKQEFNENGSISNNIVGEQELEGEGSNNPEYLKEEEWGIRYPVAEITKPTRFLVYIKEGNRIKQELFVWVFPANWKNHENVARKVTLLYPLKGSTELFLQGETDQNYLKNLEINYNNIADPILKYGADSLKIFGSVPDETLLFYIKNPTKKYAEEKLPMVLARITGKTFATITGELYNLFDAMYKAAEWASQLDEVIEISTGESYKIDLLKDIGNNNSNFLQSLGLLRKLKEKVDDLIVKVENNDLSSCLDYLEAIQTLTVGNNPASENKNDHIIDYSDYGMSCVLKTESESCHSTYSQVIEFPLIITLADELSNIKSWRASHHKYLDAYFGGGMSQDQINVALAEIGASPVLNIDTLQSNLGLSDEDKKDGTNDVMDVYEPIIMNLLDISRILINASLLSDRGLL